MRKALDALYALSAALSAIALVAIAVIVVLQVITRGLGTQFRGSDDFAGYALAATSFLALGPTYRYAEHIRVGLLVERLTGARRAVFEALALAIASLGVGWACYWTFWFAFYSWQFDELSQGLVPVPLWIPQSAMFFGFAVFLIALLEDLIVVLRGGTPSYLKVKRGTDAPVFER